MWKSIRREDLSDLLLQHTVCPELGDDWPKQSWAEPYLQDDGDDNYHSDAAHHAAEVREEGLAAAPGPDVELLNAVVVVVVGGVIGQVVLDAGPRGPGVTAAERDTVHQVLPLHVTEDTTAGQRESTFTSCLMMSS